MKNVFNMYIIIIFVLFVNFTFTQTQGQVDQAIKQIQKTGMSKEEVQALAKRKGIRQKDLNDVIQNVSFSDKENESLIKSSVIKALPPLEEDSSKIQSVKINKKNLLDKIDIYDQSVTNKPANTLKYFGYDIFERDPSIFQSATIGVINPNYIIGTGDEIIVMLWGETQFRQVLEVNREGFIFIPEVGQVFVNGLTLDLMESKLFKVLSQVYSSLNPSGRKATTFLDISLGNLRPLRIQVFGDVAQPGAYTVSPTATLFSSLYYFNGPTVLGSLRDIRLIRNEKKIASIDFYDYLLTGKKVEDLRLQLDDVIFIPKRQKTITIRGEISRPGIYELKNGETLLDLINIAGEVKATAYYYRLQIDRIVPFEERKELDNERVYIDLNLSKILKGEETITLHDGDEVRIFSIDTKRINSVEISGAINRPGLYEVVKGMKIKDLIFKADSLMGDAYLDRIDIIRTRDNLEKELIKVNLDEVLKDNPDHNLIIKGQDVIKIYSMTSMIGEEFVTITGHIKKPGKYNLYKNMRIYDLIFSSGGMLDKKWLEKTYLEKADLIRYDLNQISKKLIKFNLKEILENPNTKKNLKLKPGDEVKIYSNNVINAYREVKILGDVKFEGSYFYKEQMTLKDLILESGGISTEVFKYEVEIARIDPNNDIDENYAKIIKFEKSETNLNTFDGLSKNSKLDFLLKPYDIVTIRPDPNFKMQKNVEVSGEVYYPGTYSLRTSNETISDIINRAGGLRPTAYPESSTLQRGGKEIKLSIKDALKKKSGYNISLQGGDRLMISKKPKTIAIIGQVSVPGLYKHFDGKRVNYYLAKAGGLNLDAERKNIWVQGPDGSSKRYNRIFRNPKVLDGSQIYVEKKVESEPFDRTEFATEFSAIIANLAQIIAIIHLSNK